MLKKNLHTLFKILLSIFLFLGCISLYWTYFITSAWRQYYSIEEMRELAKKIEKVQSLSPTFYAIYDKLYPNVRHKSMSTYYRSAIWHFIFNQTINLNSQYHIKAALLIPTKSDMNAYPEFTIAWGLDKYVSAEKCFDFVTRYQFDNYKKINHLNIEVEHLTDTIDILNFLVVSKSPAFYSSNPKLVQKRVNSLRNELR